MTKWRMTSASLGVLMAGVLGASFAPAAPLALIEGEHYRMVATPEPVTTGKKIEVLEVFSYGCIHCFEFESALKVWKLHKPADAELVFMPATFNSNFALFARGFYTADALGVVEKTHSQVFDALWKNGFQVENLDQLANLYMRLGVDHDKFLATAKSMGIDAALNTATEKSRRLRLEGTPTIYIDGKYEMLRTKDTTDEQIAERLDALIAKARAERKKAN
jgi:protein dithiol oxidoreductase (disulfide-forming)